MTPASPITVCFPFTGDVVGGSHFSALGLIKALDGQRVKPIVLPQKANGAIATFFRDAGVEVQASPASAELGYARPVGPLRYMRTLFDLPEQVRHLRRLGVDIVHTNDGRTHANWAMAARLAGAGLLWHHRGDPGASGLRFIAPLLASRVVAVSHFALPDPGVWSARSRSEVVHSPFDTAVVEDRKAARAAILRELGSHEDTWLLGYMGAFVERKRPSLFIDAVVELVRRHPAQPIAALMFGEDYDARTGRALIAHAHRRGVAHVVKFMGFRDNGPFWLAGCDLLMVPAIGEPFGRTLVEAMLVGTPVVATASGGNPEALRGGALGLLVPPESASELAQACHHILNNPALTAAMTKAAAEDARTRFGIERHASRIVSIYAEILAARPPRPLANRNRAST
ncbi:MAG: glycosyltransferase family 1 protein [Novosphingobium sp.]|nr:MAG: glycosyltransferase family 1 protein [Novosphingobium sp.]